MSGAAQGLQLKRGPNEAVGGSPGAMGLGDSPPLQGCGGRGASRSGEALLLGVGVQARTGFV